MTEYKSERIIYGKSKWIVVDETENIINRNPSKEELKGLNEFPKENYKRKKPYKYTDRQLLNYLTQFYEEYGRPPTEKDFTNDQGYPDYSIYKRRFGSWASALKLAGLDVESMVKKGIIETEYQKGRFGEMIIRDHFEKHPIDLAGENCISPCDGICPNGKMYDVKSSALGKERNRWTFGINNKYKGEIEIYYILAFNKDYSELVYAWRIPAWEVINKNSFRIGPSSSYEFNIENMKKYDITEKIREVLTKYEFFNKSKKLEIRVHNSG